MVKLGKSSSITIKIQKFLLYKLSVIPLMSLYTIYKCIWSIGIPDKLDFFLSLSASQVAHLLNIGRLYSCFLGLLTAT